MSSVFGSVGTVTPVSLQWVRTGPQVGEPVSQHEHSLFVCLSGHGHLAVCVPKSVEVTQHWDGAPARMACYVLLGTSPGLSEPHCSLHLLWFFDGKIVEGA